MIVFACKDKIIIMNSGKREYEKKLERKKKQKK